MCYVGAFRLSWVSGDRDSNSSLVIFILVRNYVKLVNIQEYIIYEIKLLV